MKVFNPATEELIIEVPEGNKTSVQHAFNELKIGQKDWTETSINQRISIIEKFSDLLLRDSKQLSDVLTAEVGKPITQSKAEIMGARERIKYFIKNSEAVLANREAYRDNQLVEMVSFEPLGVVANISAWNYPYLVGVNVFIPALIAGNAVLYKPSEYSTLTGLEIEKLLQEAGVPVNVFKCVVGSGEVGQLLLDLPLDGYFFTGSYKTGKHIYTHVAPKMVPCQMELGGKDALYVSEFNSNIIATAKAAAEGVFYNNGQSCCAVERIYVHQDVYAKFLKAFIDEAKTFIIGSPKEAGVFLGPLARKEQLQVLMNQVKDALDKGAKLELGGKAIERKGYYFEPTVFTNVNQEMSVMMEESFGPIIGVNEVQSREEAIKLMQDTEYGLTAAIYSENYEEFELMARQMNTGTVYWNCCDRVSANVPWSGRKNSGFGCTLSLEGIKAFVRPKSLQMKQLK